MITWIFTTLVSGFLVGIGWIGAMLFLRPIVMSSSQPQPTNSTAHNAGASWRGIVDSFKSGLRGESLGQGREG